MDELQRAVAQFYPPASRGITGGFNPPPGPTPPPENYGLGLIPGAQEGDQPEAGPSQQPYFFRPNASFESSIRNRILKLEDEGTLFLLDKEKGQYWADVKQALDQSHSQSEYTRILEFENRDLQIREQKHECYKLFQQVLSEHPALVEKAYYNPQEAFIDFFFEERDKLEAKEPDPRKCSPAEIDREELRFLDKVELDIREHGPNSTYINRILKFN